MGIERRLVPIDGKPTKRSAPLLINGIRIFRLVLRPPLGFTTFLPSKGIYYRNEIDMDARCSRRPSLIGIGSSKLRIQFFGKAPWLITSPLITDGTLMRDAHAIGYGIVGFFDLWEHCLLMFYLYEFVRDVAFLLNVELFVMIFKGNKL